MGLISLLTISPLFFLIDLLALLISITIHEAAHAWAADRLGDPTPKIQGRLTLNPLSHLDPFGTILLIFTGFGWGRPVEFDPYNLKDRRKGAALIALAGPTSNMALAIILSLLARYSPLGETTIGLLLYPIIMVNVSLAIFNLVPIHPLDGGKILIGIAPREVAHDWDRLLHQYGTWILLLLILPLWQRTSPVQYLITPIIQTTLRFLLGV